MPPVNNPALSKVAGTAIGKFLLATLNASDVADLCSATTQPAGQTMDDVDAGELQGIRLPTAGTLELTASKAIAIHVPVYTDASGKITDTPVTGCHLVGISLAAAGADGDIIDVLPSALAALVVKTIAAATYAAPNASALNTGDATSDTVIGSIRTQLIALAADVAAIRTALQASKLFA
jgi:hypothetical protein